MTTDGVHGSVDNDGIELYIFTVLTTHNSLFVVSQSLHVYHERYYVLFVLISSQTLLWAGLVTRVIYK